MQSPIIFALLQYLYCAVVFAGLFLFLGLGLTLLFCPHHLKRYTLFLAPAVGYCYTTLSGWYAYNLFPGGTDSYASYLMILPAGFLVYALYKDKDQFGHMFHRDLLWPFGIALFVFCVISLPFLHTDFGAISISLGSNDISDSASLTRMLKEFSRTETAGFLGQQKALRWLSEDVIFGGPFSVAVASSVFHLQPYQIQSLSLSVFHAFSVLGVYVLARNSFRYTRFAAIGVTALYGLNPIMHYVTLQGFQGQIFSVYLSVFLVFLYLDASRRCRRWSDYYKYLPLITLLNWGISITYPHLIVFIYLPLAAYIFLMGIYLKSWIIPFRWIALACLALATMAFLSPYRARALVVYFFEAGRQGGFPWRPFLSPDTIFGLSLGSGRYLLPSTLQIYLSMAVVLIVITGLIYAFQKNRQLFLLASSFLVLVLSGYALLLGFGRSRVIVGGNYSGFKLLTYFIPFLLPSSLLIFRYSTFSRANGKRYGLSILLGLLVLGNLYTSLQLLPRTVHFVVTSDMVGLQAVEKNPDIHSINIRGADYWNIMWATYFLMHKRLYFETSTYMGREAGPLAGEWDLIKRSPGNLQTMDSHLCGGVIEVNATYLLVKACASQTDHPAKANG